MKPILHAKSSVRKWGGEPEDYVMIHDYMDYSKAFWPDVRHRIAMHHSLGCWMVEDRFGHELINSSGKRFSPRDVAEQHCLEDHGTILTFRRWLQGITAKPPALAQEIKDEGRESFFKILMRPLDFEPDHPYAAILLLNDYGIWLVRESLGDQVAHEAVEWIRGKNEGVVPAFEDIAKCMTIQGWMSPPKTRERDLTR